MPPLTPRPPTPHPPTSPAMMTGQSNTVLTILQRAGRAWGTRQWLRLWWKVLLVGVVAWVVAGNLVPRAPGAPSLASWTPLALDLVLGAALPPVCFMLYWYEECRDAHLPFTVAARALSRALIAGGLAGLGSAMLVEYVWLFASTWPRGVVIGIVEETAAALALVLTSHGVARQLPHRLHGLLVGLAVGVGFASVETLTYGVRAANQGMQLANMGAALSFANAVLLARVLLVPLGYVAWAGMLGAVLWRERNVWQQHLPGQPAVRRRLRAVLNGLLAFVGVVALNILWGGSLFAVGPGIDFIALGRPLLTVLLIGPLDLLFLVYLVADARGQLSPSPRQRVRALAFALRGSIWRLSTTARLADARNQIGRVLAATSRGGARTPSPPVWGPLLPPSPDDPTTALAPTAPLPTPAATSAARGHGPDTTAPLALPVQPTLAVHVPSVRRRSPGGAAPARDATPTTGAVCPHCRTPNRAAAHYCAECGHRLFVPAQP